ncbi:hypothetical protein PQX77_002273 [Marasmius sp. AFHP31]|nr:hypothetical protein PQX77_002273 [Marasmius sp. AFHP31]
MPSTFASPSVFTPDDHIQVFFEALVEFGFELVDLEALFSEPGFENLLCSAQFEQLLCRFPPQDLSDHSLEVLIRMVTNGIILENLSDEELVPPFVTLLANMLEQKGHRMGAQKSIHRRWLSLSTEPGSSTLHKPTNGQIMTIHPTFPSVHSVQVDNKDSAISYNSVIPLEFPSPSNMDTHPSVVSDIPQRSHRLRPGTSPTHKQPFLQPTPSSYTFPVRSALPHVDNAAIRLHSAFNSQHASRDINHVVSPSGLLPSNEDMPLQLVPTSKTSPALSALPRVNGPLIDPGSAINSKVPRYCTSHISLSSGSLSPNNTSPSRATIGQSNGLVIRSYPTLSRVDYKLHSSATQRSPQPESQQGVLDKRDYFPGGIDQHDINQRGIHHDGLPYLQRAAHATVDSTLPPSVFIPDHSAIPSSQTPYGPPRLIKGSTFLPVGNALDLASSDDDCSEKIGHKEPVGTERWCSAIHPKSGFNLQKASRWTVGNVSLPSQPLPQSRSNSICSVSTYSNNMVNCSLPRDDPVIPRRSCMQQTRTSLIPTTMLSQLETPSSTLPAWSVLLHIDGPSIHPGSAINSQVPECPISHVSKPFQTSVHAEQPTSNWWNHDWSSDSLFSSDGEDGTDGQHGHEETAGNKQSYEVNSFCGSGSGIHSPDLPYNDDSALDPDICLHRNHPDDDHVDSGFRKHEDDGSQSGYVDDFPFDAFGVSQQPDDQEILRDSSPDPGYDGQEDGHHTNLEEVDFEYANDEIESDDDASQQSDDLEDSLDNSPDPEYDEQDDHHLVSLNEVGCDQDPESEDANSVGDNGEVRSHFGDEEPPFDDGNSNGFDFDDHASQHSDELEISPNDSTHLEPEELGDDGLFYESGDEDTEYNDGASQRSDDWGIPPDGQSDQGYESPCEDDKYYEDEIDQYEYGDVGNPDEYLVLVSQHFPHSLWSLQLPKPTLLLQPPKQNSYQSFDLSTLQTILANNLSSHIPFFVTFAAFEQFFRSTCNMFVQNLRISRHFISYLEGTNVVLNYREHLLLPEDDELDSQFGEEDIKVTHDAMDDLFGNSGSDEISSYDDNEYDNGVEECPDDLGVPYDNKSQEEPDERSGDNGTYIALISQDFPHSLQSLQSPKTRKFYQLTPPSSLTTTILHPHPAHITVLDTLASLGHTPRLSNTARAETPPFCRKNWVGLLNEEAATNAASNQRLKPSSINGHSVPVYPSTYHDFFLAKAATSTTNTKTKQAIPRGENRRLNGGVKTPPFVLFTAYFFLVVLPIPPVSCPGSIVCNRSPPIDHVRAKVTRNLHGGSSSLLVTSSSTLMSQTAIYSARSQADNRLCSSPPPTYSLAGHHHTHLFPPRLIQGIAQTIRTSNGGRVFPLALAESGASNRHDPATKLPRPVSAYTSFGMTVSDQTLEENQEAGCDTPITHEFLYSLGHGKRCQVTQIPHGGLALHQSNHLYIASLERIGISDSKAAMNMMDSSQCLEKNGSASRTNLDHSHSDFLQPPLVDIAIFTSRLHQTICLSMPYHSTLTPNSSPSPSSASPRFPRTRIQIILPRPTILPHLPRYNSPRLRAPFVVVVSSMPPRTGVYQYPRLEAVSIAANIQHDEWREEIECDVPGAPNPSTYLLLCRTFQSWSSFSPDPPLMYAVVSIWIVRAPVDLGLSHTGQRSSLPPNFASTYDSQLGDRLGGNGALFSPRDMSNPLTVFEIKLVQVGLIKLGRNGQYRAGHVFVLNHFLFVTSVVRNVLNKNSVHPMVLDKSLLVQISNHKVTLWSNNTLSTGAHFSPVTFIFPPISHPGCIVCDDSPLINIVVDRTTRNRRDARFQINQPPCHRSTPHHFIIVQFPPPFARSALDFRDGFLPSNITTSKPRNPSQISLTRGNRQLAIARISDEGSPQPLHSQIVESSQLSNSHSVIQLCNSSNYTYRQATPAGILDDDLLQLLNACIIKGLQVSGSLQPNPHPLCLFPPHSFARLFINSPGRFIVNSTTPALTRQLILETIPLNSHQRRLAATPRTSDSFPSPPYLSLIWSGAAEMFDIELMNWTSSNVVAKQINQHGKSREIGIHIPRFQPTGLSIHPNQRHPTPREAAKSTLIACRRGPPPIILLTLTLILFVSPWAKSDQQPLHGVHFQTSQPPCRSNHHLLLVVHCLPPFVQLKLDYRGCSLLNDMAMNITGSRFKFSPKRSEGQLAALGLLEGDPPTIMICSSNSSHPSRISRFPTLMSDSHEGHLVLTPRISDVPPTTSHLFICTSKKLTWVPSTVSLSDIWDLPSSKWNPHIMDESSVDTQTNPLSNAPSRASNLLWYPPLCHPDLSEDRQPPSTRRHGTNSPRAISLASTAPNRQHPTPCNVAGIVFDERQHDSLPTLFLPATQPCSSHYELWCPGSPITLPLSTSPYGRRHQHSKLDDEAAIRTASSQQRVQDRSTSHDTPVFSVMIRSITIDEQCQQQGWEDRRANTLTLGLMTWPKDGNPLTTFPDHLLGTYFKDLKTFGHDAINVVFTTGLRERNKGSDIPASKILSPSRLCPDDPSLSTIPITPNIADFPLSPPIRSPIDPLLRISVTQLDVATIMQVFALDIESIEHACSNTIAMPIVLHKRNKKNCDRLSHIPQTGDMNLPEHRYLVLQEAAKTTRATYWHDPPPILLLLATLPSPSTPNDSSTLIVTAEGTPLPEMLYHFTFLPNPTLVSAVLIDQETLTSLERHEWRTSELRVKEPSDNRDKRNIAPSDSNRSGPFHLPFVGIELSIFFIPVAPLLDCTIYLSPIVIQCGISPECQLEIIPDCSSTIHGRFITSIRPGNQPVPPISSAARLQNIRIREYMGKIITNAPSLVRLLVPLAYNSCDKLPTATTHRRDSCGLATKRNVGLLMMEVGRRKEKDYVMKKQTMCIVIEVHSVGFHATSGLVRHHQLLNMPPGKLVQGWRPENGQSSSPGRIFQSYRLERAQAQHTSHHEIAHLLTSAF